MTEKTGTEISEAMDNDFKYSKDDICKICGVADITFKRFLAMQPLSQRDFTSIGSSHKKLYKENALKQFQVWLMKNQINQGVQVKQVKNNIGKVSDIENFKYSKDDICNLCGVIDRTFERFLAVSQVSAVSPIAERDYIIVGPRNKHYYNENVLKQFQAWLMKNQINQGTQVKQVKANVENNVKLGLSFQEIVASGNIEAMRELTTFAMNACAEVARNKQLEAEKKALEEQNTQLIEQKNAAEAETERIKQYNRNFHTSLYTATEVAKMLGVTPNRIGREAKNHNLKLEPLYGMLGKIKLDNGKLVDQFCYNDDAIRILKAIIGAD